MDFFKAHGTGNDFVVLVDLDDRLDLDDHLVRALCNRRFGVGADGVLRLGASEAGDVFMDYRNADGSVVEMCGNGVRVVAKHAVDHGIVEGDTVKVDTRDGVKAVQVHRGQDGTVASATVDMGAPTVSKTEVVEVDDTWVELVSVDIGNPHAVIRVQDVTTAEVLALGRRLERHDRFPDGVNVEFARVRDDGHVDLRVWERGVGETAACGTGACATQAALRRLDLVGDDVTIHLPGGDLQVRWAGEGSVEMTGPAVEVASGTLDEAWLAAARAGAFDRSVLA